MPFDPKNFLVVAHQLFATATSEAEYRTVLGRAYYSAFGFSERRRGIFTDVGLSVHKKVIESFKSSVIDKERMVGRKLEFLFSERKKADYNYNIKVVDWHCKNVLASAKEVFDLFREIDVEKSNQDRIT